MYAQGLLLHPDVADGSWLSSNWLSKVLNHPANNHIMSAGSSNSATQFLKAVDSKKEVWKLLVQYHKMVGWQFVVSLLIMVQHTTANGATK